MLKRIFPILILLIAATGAAAQQPVAVSYDDDRAPESLSAWTLAGEGEMLFFRANDVARLFRATQFWNATSRKVVLGVAKTRFILTVDTRVVVIDGEPVMLRSPIRYDSGFVMIPLEFILEVASHYTAWTFSWDADSRTLSVGGYGYNVEQVAFSSAANRTTATITLTEPLMFHMDANTPGLVRLKLYGGRVDARAFTHRDRRGLIEGVRAEQSERDAFIYFAVERHTTRIRIDREDDPDRIVLVLEKGDLPEIPETEFEGSRVVEIVDETSAERRTILDAGGGHARPHRGQAGSGSHHDARGRPAAVAHAPD
jgi:hypothetical protein